MIEMDLLFLISILCVFSCIFFTIGQFIEKKESTTIHKRDIKILSEDVLIKSNSKHSDFVDVEYEEVYPEGVINFQEFKNDKEKLRDDIIDEAVGYEWMYSNREDKYVKVPRDIADFIKYLKENMEDGRHKKH